MASLTNGAAQLLFGAAVMILVLVIVPPTVGKRPSYVKCTSNSECKDGYCCVLGMERYSSPSCMPRRGEGIQCRIASEKAQNLTVGYPNNDSVDLVNVHLIYSSCADGLYCDKKTSQCTKKPTVK